MRVQGAGTLPPGAKKGNPKVALVRLRVRCRYKARRCSACVAFNSQDRHLKLRWVSPIRVNAELSDDLLTVVRPADER